MNFLIDAVGATDDRSGAARRILELYPRAARLAAGRHRFHFLASKSFLPWIRERTDDLPGVSFTAAPSLAGRVMARLTAHRLRLATLVREAGIDVICSDLLPPLLPSLTWTTVHDLRFLGKDAPFARRLYGRYLLPRVLRRSARVIAVSEFTRRGLEESFGLARIDVLPNGVDVERFRAPSPSRAAIERWELDRRPFLLGVGHREPRKNIRLALEALALLRARGLDLRLFWAGRDAGADRALESLIVARGLESHVLFAEDVATSELPALYREARAFLFPSVYEGFGLPILEALAAGCPAFVRAPLVIDGLDPAALTMLPDDPAAWANALEPLLREKRRIDRTASLAHFSWDRSAAAFLALAGAPTACPNAANLSRRAPGTHSSGER